MPSSVTTHIPNTAAADCYVLARGTALFFFHRQSENMQIRLSDCSPCPPSYRFAIFHDSDIFPHLTYSLDILPNETHSRIVTIVQARTLWVQLVKEGFRSQ